MLAAPGTPVNLNGHAAAGSGAAFGRAGRDGERAMKDTGGVRLGLERRAAGAWDCYLMMLRTRWRRGTVGSGAEPLFSGQEMARKCLPDFGGLQ